MTDIQKVRLLIGDSAATRFPADGDIQGFLDISLGSILMAAALALDSLAAAQTSSITRERIGDYEYQQSAAAFAVQAQRFRELEYNTPAWAVAEESLSEFNVLTIIRNYILRTEP